MLKKLRTKHLVLTIFLLALAGLLGFRIFQAVKSEAQPMRGGGPGMRMQTVQAAAVTRGSIGEKVTLTGSLQPKEQVDVSPKMSGRIVQMRVDTGQPVARGALIAVIEDDEIQQQVERSKAAIAVGEASISQREAELNNAKAEMERKRRLVEAGLLSRQEYETVETRYRVAESQLELARAQKRQSQAEQRELSIRQGQTRVYSPISGIIAKRHVDTGAMVNASVPIVTVVNVGTMVIMAKASERDIARIKPGTTATVIIDSLPGQTWTGRVMRISPVLDPQTRNGEVEIEIDNRGGVLKGEMFARVELDLGTSRETTLIPRDALVYRGDQPGVYIIESDTAKFRPVETGLTQEDKVEVLSGLTEGETVIAGGANLVKDGDKVQVMGGPGRPQAGPKPEERKEGGR
ncbi:MAG TPA: efflux RND transporter periplasmic adaptor subunit [Blastocatellia bacterium]|nr:efflux RND transporter periplasmic adaptor subunit [Blastocatellia bacterium]